MSAQPDPEASRAAPQSLTFPALLVLLSSCGLAGATLVLTPEASWNVWMWPARDELLATLAGSPLLRQGVQAALFLALIGLGTAGWLLGARRIAADAQRSSLRVVLAVGALAMLPQLLVRPFWSNDVFLYELHARTALVYGENPYVTAGADLPKTCAAPSADHSYATCRVAADCPGATACVPDLYVNLSPWANQTTPYGPLSLGIAMAAHSEDLDPFDNSVLIRLLAALCLLGAAACAGWLVHPGAAALLCWSPVGWMESANTGHIEAFLALAVVAVSLALLRAGPRAPLAAGLAIGAAALIKIPALMLAPAAMAVGRKPATALRVAVAAGLLVAAGYALVWAPPHPFGGLLVEAGKSDKSLVHVATLGLERVLGHSPRPWLGLALLTGFVVWLASRARRVATAEDAVWLMAATWLLSILVVVGRFHPWHTLPLLALSALLPDRAGVKRAAITLAALAPAVEYTRYLATLDHSPMTSVPTTLAVFGATLLAWRGPSRSAPRTAPNADSAERRA